MLECGRRSLIVRNPCVTYGLDLTVASALLFVHNLGVENQTVGNGGQDFRNRLFMRQKIEKISHVSIKWYIF